MMPADDVRYAVADVNYNTKDGPRTEMVFIMWAPDTASVKRRMISASSKEVLKNILVGCKTQVQATCLPDLELREIVEKFKGSLD
jgi:cofilin